jgi:hypothetical protein
VKEGYRSKKNSPFESDACANLINIIENDANSKQQSQIFLTCCDICLDDFGAAPRCPIHSFALSSVGVSAEKSFVVIKKANRHCTALVLLIQDKLIFGT